MGDVFAGGWLLENAECSETGVYYYSFKNAGMGELTIALNLAMVKNRDIGNISNFGIYVDGVDETEAFPSEVTALRDEIAASVERWELRLKAQDKVAWAIVVALMIISVIWITALAERSKRAGAGPFVNAQVFLASLLFIVSVAELGFRGFDVSYKDSGLMAFMADVRDQAILHGGFRRLEKSASDAADSARDVNALGYRGDGHDTEKEAGTLRIVCAGDSFTFGIGVGSEWTFPVALKKELSKILDAGRIEILNFGVPGSSATDVSSILLAEAASSTPDLIIYGYVLNDVELGKFLDARAYYDGIGFRADNLDRIIRRHDLGGLRRHIRIYHFLIGRFEDHLLNGLILDTYLKSYEPEHNPDGLKRLEKDFSMISDYYSARGIPVILMVYPILVKLDESYPFAASHDRVIAMAQDAGMHGLDLLPFYKGRNPETLWASRTDHHPNREGHRIAAAAAADFIIKEDLLKPVLRDLPSGAETRDATKTLSADAAVSMAKSALDRNDPDAALFLIAEAIETNPGNCDWQELAAEILQARGASRAVAQKIKRMKTISPLCASKAEAFELR